MPVSTLPPQPEARRPYILVVDDDAILAQMLSIFFRRQGCDAGLASSASEALLAMATVRPDAVLVDLHLPGEPDGVGLLEAMRARHPLRAVPVLVMTGEAPADTPAWKALQWRLHQSGALLYRKPVPEAVLLAWLGSVLQAMPVRGA